MSKLVLILLVALIVAAQAASKFTADQKDQLLFGHNKARLEKGVAPLVWDDTVASYAQDYSDSCPPGPSHHQGSPYGENIAWGGGLGVITANQLWIDGEYSSKWQCPQAIDGSNYDHYSQVMWSGTTKVGCGITQGCSYGTFIVCNFDPPGNYLGQKPYSGSCNSITPCTPSKTCTEAGGSFSDAKCGQITCCGANICSGGSSSTTGTSTTPAPTKAPTPAPTTVATPRPTPGPTTKATPSPTSPAGGLWVYQDSFLNSFVPFVNPDNSQNNADSYSGHGAVYSAHLYPYKSANYDNFFWISRSGGVTNTFTNIVFDGATMLSSQSVTLYFNGGCPTTKTFTSAWQSFSIPLSSLCKSSGANILSSSGSQLIFAVAQNSAATVLYIDNLRLV